MIAHVDADSFFASVIIRTHPQYRGKSLFALGMGGSCIIAATYEAKAKGVKTGMRVTDARKLCPGAIEMSADFRETALASKQIEETIRDHCPIIEQMSIDEWYLDINSLVGGIPSDPGSWGKELQKTILQNTGLSVSIGIAPSKLLAKMAGEYRKPAGVTVIDLPSPGCPASAGPGGGVRPAHRSFSEGGGGGSLESFLKDRPAPAIPGIGRQREIQTEAQGWHTAWDIANADPALVRSLFGKNGTDMQRELLGERVSPVSMVIRPPQSISRCRSFRATSDLAIVRAHLLKHLEYCVMKMRRWKLGCTDVSLWLRDKDMHHIGAHKKLLRIEQTTLHIITPAMSLLDALTLDRNQKYTQVGFALYNLKPIPIHQQSLFEDPRVAVAEEHLQEAMDTLHAKFGRDSLTRGSALAVNTGTRKELDLPMVE